MTKILCNRLDLIHVSNVNWIGMNIVHLKEGQKFISTSLVESIVYQCSRTNDTAGSLMNETVTAKVKLTPEIEQLIRISLKNYILRLYTDNLLFFVGCLDYPSELTYSSDKIFVNLTFKRTSPLL